ncbi:MAG: response regulator transcription factor [Burkholderiaceae bacterium]
MKVFVVEDSEAICDRIVRMVNKVKNTNVAGTANSVSGALRGIENMQPDVVILDIQLLDGDGMQVLQHVRKVMPFTKTMVLTNFNSDQYRGLALRFGADAFLDKSNDFFQIPDLLLAWHQQREAVAH